MSYSIYFVNKNNLYLQVGFESSRQSKKMLEEIANCLPDGSSAYGEIIFRNEHVEKITCYEINYDKRAILKYKGSKKKFLKG